LHLLGRLGPASRRALVAKPRSGTRLAYLSVRRGTRSRAASKREKARTPAPAASRDDFCCKKVSLFADNDQWESPPIPEPEGIGEGVVGELSWTTSSRWRGPPRASSPPPS